MTMTKVHADRNYATADHMPLIALCGRRQVEDGAPGLWRRAPAFASPGREVTCLACRRAARAVRRRT